MIKFSDELKQQRVEVRIDDKQKVGFQVLLENIKTNTFSINKLLCST